MRRGFDNLTTCVWLVYSAHGRLFDQRLKESGLGIREFMEQDGDGAVDARGMEPREALDAIQADGRT